MNSVINLFKKRGGGRQKPGKKTKVLRAGLHPNVFVGLTEIDTGNPSAVVVAKFPEIPGLMWTIIISVCLRVVGFDVTNH